MQRRWDIAGADSQCRERFGTIEDKWLQVLMKVLLGNALAEAGGPSLVNVHTIPLDSSQGL